MSVPTYRRECRKVLVCLREECHEFETRKRKDLPLLSELHIAPKLVILLSLVLSVSSEKLFRAGSLIMMIHYRAFIVRVLLFLFVRRLFVNFFNYLHTDLTDKAALLNLLLPTRDVVIPLLQSITFPRLCVVEKKKGKELDWKKSAGRFLLSSAVLHSKFISTMCSGKKISQEKD